ncbi:ribokinase [Neorhizobium sp. T786]|uniref:ribokinase n=1 Tax=Pseudorhizobium xiangyangii TaxID=2883104 RepID=UPI001D00167D|nr:ribokinase [Neorhizobium xiangyangii]MCB5205469.1 ribokinase [Neorhizobium xiangyangii]
MITVLGSINLDLVAVAERFPAPGETVNGHAFTSSAGGKGANQALAASRSGSPVRMVGGVGKDGFAAEALGMLRLADIDLSGVRTVPTATGTAVILIDSSGENMITVIAGANDAVDERSVETGLENMTAGDFLMLQLEVPASTVAHALKAAREKGVTSILNIAPFTADAPRLAAMADFVICNEMEFDMLAGTGTLDIGERIEALHRIHEHTGRAFAVTLGKDGVVAILDGEIRRAEGLKIQPLDTVGAGDTFCGYLVGSLEQGLVFDAALRRAAIAGSLACLTAGAQTSIPFSGDVDRAVAASIS